MDLVVIPLILVVLVVLLWTWWAARAGRDPVSSVDSFNRALSAMQPRGSAAPAPTDEPAAGVPPTDTAASAPN